MTIYLYVKQHKITKLKYFGVTTNANPFRYKGSGKYWLKHLKRHGRNHIDTLEIWGFDSPNLCTEFALFFSQTNNIVESNEWANLIPENGINVGLVLGFRHTEKSKQRMSKSKKGTQCGPSNPMYGKTPYNKNKTGLYKPDKDTLKKMSESHKGLKRSLEAIEKTRLKNLGRKATLEQKENFKIINSGSNNPQFGKKWVNNGSVSALVYVNDYRYNLWQKGRLMQKDSNGKFTSR